MGVTRYNYPKQFRDLDGVTSAIRQILESGQYILSQPVAEFEAGFARYCGSRNAVGLNSGTDALVLSLMALGIGPGDEVITQANTFHATVAAVCLVGAKPVLVDPDPITYAINVDATIAAIGPQTRAVIAVHLYGRAGSMTRLSDACRDAGCDLIEDAAQAHGAIVDNRRAGTLGTIGCFSFHPSKNLAAAGDGGAIVTDSDVLAERIRVLRGLGQSGQNHHVAVGLNSKLDAIQAVVLADKLPQLDDWNDARRRVALAYRTALGDLPLAFQPAEGADHVFHLFTIRSTNRDALMAFLQEQEIDAVVRYPEPIHRQAAFSEQDWYGGNFPYADALARELLCLPIRPDMHQEEIDEVCGAVRTFFDTTHA